MQSVCICSEVHLPCVLKWYWPSEGYRSAEFETYFDQPQIFSGLERNAPQIIRANEALLDSIDNGAKYTFDISGIFLDQCKWNPALIGSFQELKDRGAGFSASPYYHSVSSLFPDNKEFKEQVSMHRNKIKDIFNINPRTFINSELILTKELSTILKEMKFKCLISEGSENLLYGSDPKHVYGDQIPTLLRHISLSEDIELRFSDQKWISYPLIADKFASWIANMEGDVTTLHFKYSSILAHQQNKSDILQFLIDLPESFEKYGISMVTPEEALKKFKTKELPSIMNRSTSRYGMHNLMGNHPQHLYLHELIEIGNIMESIKDAPEYNKLNCIYRYFQQSEILLEMGDENNNHGYEKAVNIFSAISDFKRAILEVKV
ncbi:glycoside hydrolase family 57 protein [Methanococcoides sp. AM1]|uniref:glycoside hydrolase family 57 protein n=1 Tax=Methanococcoides sp. AM1 TaxID=1201011 RepID=UPI001083DB0D|nr:glycoside hydrolase family 57 protein [Methanococcoides sp. AM1]